MNQYLDKASTYTSGSRRYLLAGYYLIADNLSIATVVVGALMIVVGGTIVVSLHPTFSAMFAIWGVSAIVLGVVAYAILLANRIWARITD